MLARKKSPFLLLLGALLGLAASSAVWAQAQPEDEDNEPLGTESGFGVFQQHCTLCHGNPDAKPRAPDPSTLRQLAPERIYEALSNGTMKMQGRKLSEVAKRRHNGTFSSFTSTGDFSCKRVAPNR